MADFGETVRMHCRGTLDDGTMFVDSTAAGTPLCVKLGESALPRRVEAMLCDMFPGNRRTVRLEPYEAYGVYDAQLVESVPTKLIPNSDKLPVGDYIELKTGAGAIRAKVVSADADTVVFDCNHELAGCAVTFDVELVSIVHEAAIFRELHPAGCACGCDKLKAQLMRDKLSGRR